MDLRDLLARVRITDIADALGIPRRNTRAQAVWRKGDGWTVNLNDAKGTWFDFKTNEGSGILDFIQIVLGCSRRETVSWLCEYMGVPEPSGTFSAREKAEYARKRPIARNLAAVCALWCRGYSIELEERKRRALAAADDESLEDAARELCLVETLGAEQISMKFEIQNWLEPARTRARIERGRDDVAHSEQCFRAVLEILRQAAERSR